MRQMRKSLSESEAYARYSSLCARQECCQYDLADKMRRNGMQEEQIENVLRQLVEEGFVDDRRFSEAYVHDKVAFSRWGRIRIKMELEKRHVPSDIIRAALETVDEAVYEEQLLNLLESYGATVKAKSEYERRNKLIRHACNHGYEYDVVVGLMETHDL